MVIQTIDIGEGPDTGTGDDLRAGMQKVNDNFSSLYGDLHNHIQTVTNSMTYADNAVTLTGDLLPAADITYNIGSPELRWHSVFIGANTIYLGDNMVLGGTSITIAADPGANSLAQMPTLLTSKLVARPFTYNAGNGNVTVRPSIEFQTSDGTSHPISFNTETHEFSLDIAGNYGTGSLVAKKITLNNPSSDALSIIGNISQIGSSSQTGSLRVDGNVILGYDATNTTTVKSITTFKENTTFENMVTMNSAVTINNSSQPFTVSSNNLTLNATGATLPGNLVVHGNLTIQGSTLMIDSNQVNIGDNIIILNADIPGYVDPTENAGIQIARGTESAVKWIWDEAHDYWTPAGGDIGNVNSLTVTNLTATNISAHTHTAANISDFSEAVDDRVASLLQAGSNITLAYNDASGVLTVSAAGSSSTTFTGDVTGSGIGTIGLTLSDTGVSAASYGNSTSIPRITVDSKGRVTAASTTPVAFPITSVAGRTGDVVLLSSDIGDASSANAPNALVKRDSVGNFSAGTITATLNGNASSAIRLAVSRTLGFSGDVSGSTSFDGSTDTTTSLTLTNSGVTAGTYGSSSSFPVITVDAKGRVTSASSVAVNIPVTSVAGKTGAVVLAVSDITSLQTALDGKQVAGSYAAATHTHAISDVSGLQSALDGKQASGSYAAAVHTHVSADITDAVSTNTASTIVKRDVSGNFSAGTISASLTGNASTASKWETARLLTLSGDISGWVGMDGSANATIATTLANTSVVAGTYGSALAVPVFTVDAKGRLTTVSAVSIPTASTSAAGLVQLSTATNSTSTTTAATSSAVKSAYDLAAAALPAAGGTISGNLVLSGNLTVNGSTITVNSTVTTLDDPVLTLGGDTASTNDDNKDRGIEYRWHNGTTAKTGFFGYDDSTGYFTFIPDATNTSEVFSGTPGSIQANLVGNADTATKLATARTISTTGDATGSASFDGSANAAIALTLATSGVTAGSYGSTSAVPVITVDAKGRVTSATSSNIAFPVTTVAGRTGAITLVISDVTGLQTALDGKQAAGSYAAAVHTHVSADITDAASTNTASTIVKRDASGNFSAGTITAALTGNASTATKLATARTISASGDATGSASFDGSADAAITLALAASGVTAGSYGSTTTVPAITVDAKGRVTSAASSSIAFPVTTVAGRTGAITLAIADVTGLQTALEGKQVAGSYAAAVHTHLSADITDAASTNTASTIVKRDASGNFAAGTITAALTGNSSTATKLATARTISTTGDATGSASFDGSANAAIALTLAASGVTAGSYGSTTSVPAITVDAKGRVTAASSTAIAFPVTSVAGRTGAVTIASADITDATSANTASTLVKRDASGNFNAGTITAALAGNASTATKLATSRTISLTGAITGSASFDGSADISIATSVLAGGSDKQVVAMSGTSMGWYTLDTTYLPMATQAQAEAGTDDATLMTPLRVNQAIIHGEMTIAGGYTATSDNDGSYTSGTYTPTPTGGNFKAITNGGAFTLAAPTVAGVYTLIVEITNGAAAGAVTFSGYSKVIGSLTTTSGSKFQVFIAKTASGVTANVVAMQ